LLKNIKDMPDNGGISVDGKECEIVTADILNELYGTEKNLTIQYSGYSITIYGRDIKNINNELNTKISMTTSKDGLEILANDGNHLPGRIHIQLFDSNNYSHLYLFNTSKNSYQEIDTFKKNNMFSIDYNGKYILTQNKISNSFINWFIIIIAILLLSLGLIIAYIVIKKRHWFW